MLIRNETLSKLETEGTLEELIRIGVISNKIRKYFRYFREVQFQYSKTGSINAAVEETSKKLGIDKRTIWRAVKTIRK